MRFSRELLVREAQQRGFRPEILEKVYQLLRLLSPFLSHPYLQPFEDVNKRVSRLGANIPLIQHNLFPLSFIDVPEQAYVDARRMHWSRLKG